mgnify:CR=1 FL=1
MARQELSTTRDDESVRAIPEKWLARARKLFGRPCRLDLPNTKSRILPAGPKRILLAQRCSGTTLAGQSRWVCTAEVAQTQASPRCSGRPCNVWLSTLREVILTNWPRRMKSWPWSAEPDTALRMQMRRRKATMRTSELYTCVLSLHFSHISRL